MVKTGEGTFRWSYVFRLYSDWGTLKGALMAFGIGGAVFAVPMLFLGMWGVAAELVPGLMALATLAHFAGAWFQGGVDDWSYEMDEWGITGETTVHHPGRAKLLRNLPKRSNWTLPKDFPKKYVEVAFSKVKTVSSDERKCKIVLETSTRTHTVFVPREDHAEVLAFITGQIPQPRPKRTRKPRKPKGAVAATQGEDA